MGHPVVGVGAEAAAVQVRRPDVEPVLGLGDVAAEPVELGRQRGEPVGLVPADVGDPAQVDGRGGERAQRRDRRGQLADVVQVEVEAVHLAGSAHGQAVVGELDVGAHQPEDLAERVAGLGGRPRPVAHRDASTGHEAAARNGAALDRSGSIATSTARTGPGATRHRSGSASSTSTPRVAELVDGHLDVRQRGHRLAVVADVDALVVAGRREQQRRDELAGRRGVDGRPRRRAPSRAPTTVNGRVPRSSSSISTPRPRRPCRTSCIGRVRACGSPSKITGPSASAATGGTNRITVPARPQSTAVRPTPGTRA